MTTTKTKVQMHREICEEINDLYARKNHDYGDSFHQTFVEEGMAMARIRLGDKFNRFKTLSRSGEQKVDDESIRDTLIDLANYAIMTVLEMKQIKTVRHRLDNTCQFDDEVNNLLREGWLLKKRTVLRPFCQGSSMFVHIMLYAELEKEVADDDA